jgi:hypothetical protein
MLDNEDRVEAWAEIPDGLLTALQHRTLEQDELTYEYLEAGARLIAGALGTREIDQGDHPFLRWVSRSAIFHELRDSDLKVGDGSFRYRWQYHADYIRDLVAYVRWRRNTTVLPVHSAAPIEHALNDPNPSVAIQAVAQLNLEGLFANTYFPLQLVALAVVGASSSDVDVDVAGDFYVEASKQWRNVFKAFLDRYGLALRDEIVLDDLVEVLMATGEGLALRELAEPTKGKRHKRRLQLQALAAMALLTVTVDNGDSRTIAERTDTLLSEQRNQTA